jgi:hypothetical protein
VLIEENLRGPGLGTMDIFNVVKEGSERAAPLMLRIAYVDVNPEHDRKALEFGENVAVNRGMNVKVFSSVAEAEHWLTDISSTAG